MPYWREHRIRKRAYAILEQEGRPDGKDREHWLRAEAEIAAEERDALKKLRSRRRGLSDQAP
jgi:hypothetical protein